MGEPWKRPDEEGRRCGAKSKQTGEQCKRWVKPGFRTCYYHGSARPSESTQMKARIRLTELVDPAVATLARIMVSSRSETNKMRAAENILDRGGAPRGLVVDSSDAREVLAKRLVEYRNEAGLEDEVESFDGDGDVVEGQVLVVRDVPIPQNGHASTNGNGHA